MRSPISAPAPMEYGALLMCGKCVEIDDRIEHYRQISRWVNDKLTLEGIEILIAKYLADKEALHPVPK